MNIILLLVGLLVVLAQADDISWTSFQVKFNKSYTSSELQLRGKIFNENLQKIEEHNKKYEQGLVSYKLGINQFSDLTEEEFAAKFKTLQVDEKSLQGGLKTYDFTYNDIKALPESIDWRSNNSIVTEVKDQGTCGGCWAFSATGTIEGQLALRNGTLLSLSEQQLLDCDTSQNKGCQGGVVQYAIDYVTKNGLALEKDYPYLGVQQSCSATKSKNKVAWTKNYVNILQNNETDLKLAVGLIGPISVAINADQLSAYETGIFNSACSTTLNHGVLAVGYGKDASGVEYWIIKNSWGKTWGEEGYFKLAMGRNLCGVASQACYPILRNSAYSIKGGVLLYLIVFIYMFLY